MAENLINAGLAQKISELRRADALERGRSLRAAEAGLGAPPEEFVSEPYQHRGTGVPTEATMRVPSRSSYATLSPEEREQRLDDSTERGLMAGMFGAAPLIGGTVGGLAAAAEGAGALGIAGGAGMGAAGSPLFGLFGQALTGAMLPYAGVGRASDIAAGEAFRTPATAGRFTPGPGMAAELEGSYFPEQPWTSGMGIEGQTITPGAGEAAADRIEGARAAHQQRQEALSLQQQQEMAEYQRRLEEARAQEAARQMALERMFGAPQDRAEDIISLEALRRAR